MKESVSGNGRIVRVTIRVHVIIIIIMCIRMLHGNKGGRKISISNNTGRFKFKVGHRR